VRPIFIEWDGTNVPKELQKLPPGSYLIGPAYEMWDEDELTPEEEAGIEHALAQVEAGEVIPYEEAMRQIRAELAELTDDGTRTHPRRAR
jgi:hypothetical protein